jgi:hypothetical protein
VWGGVVSVLALNPQVNIETHRCYECGRWWALEQGWDGDCPGCAHTKRMERYEALESALRSIRSLKGALTKAKRAAK